MRVRSRHQRSVLARIRDFLDYFAHTTPARFAIAVFLGLIVVETTLLLVPGMTTSGEMPPLHDALFTAVSAICVTGLTTVDMAAYWTPLGHAVIALGVQIGGIGVLTLASIMGLVVSRRLGLRAKLMAASDSNPLRIHHGPVAESQAVKLGEIGTLLLTVAISALVIEATLALLLLPRILVEGVPFPTALLDSFYWSLMAFTNTGFILSDTGFDPYLHDYWFLSLLIVGVFLGSIGFPVIYAVLRNRRKPRRWSVHVKLTLVTTLLLIGIGMLAYMLLEWENPATFGPLPPGERAFQSLFFSVMTRSGGFSTIDVHEMNNASLLVGDMLMFIGGGSASTAGGIKVTTLAVLFLAAFAEARGNESMEAFERRIPGDVLRLAVSVVLWGATTVALSTVVLLQISGSTLDYVLFDVISAFATSGLTTGLTADLPPSGVYVLAATMFMGRVGTVTLAAALAASTRRQLFTRSEERPIVG
ncbi:TrkH family potassium uptake protein [Planctomonas psychrotolerans]|uniref:TrkH family potassium uptake protein n=1 Tax=Planctomonas psychrotolerans TaxID=2528712 RepID=UPI00123C5547|nr:potassium transporter TrkG [Planctomonas psychrotolerans]